MAREKLHGTCEHCGKAFEYYLIHNGFNESSYAYCDKCGMTALLEGWRIPNRIHVESHQAISPDVERLPFTMFMRWRIQSERQSTMPTLP